jgi:uncharacterized glyoxalase superfamily protein PhnB
MLENRSVPAGVLLPHLVCSDLEKAIAWLALAFGFAEHYRYGGGPQGPPSGAQLHLGDAWIMVRAAREGSGSPAQLGGWTQSLTICVADVEGHYQQAKAARAKIVEEPHETEYGEFQYGVEDLEGHYRLFSRHARDVSPEEWGARLAKR